MRFVAQAATDSPRLSGESQKCAEYPGASLGQKHPDKDTFPQLEKIKEILFRYPDEKEDIAEYDKGVFQKQKEIQRLDQTCLAV